MNDKQIKRLCICLPSLDYEAIKDEAHLRRLSVSGFMRGLWESWKEAKEEYQKEQHGKT